MRIGEVSAWTDISAATLRYYEREGLLPAPRRRSGKRCYEATDIDRIRLLKVARAMGFNIAELRVLAAKAGGDRRGQALTQRLARTEADLAQLARQRELLSAALNCTCASPDECAVLV